MTRWPLPDAWLGVWQSGTMGDSGVLMVAWVEAESEADVYRVVREQFPDAEAWRFVGERNDPPRGGRFPKPNWAPIGPWTPSADPGTA